jgi:flagellar basal body-associated protein FliL
MKTIENSGSRKMLILYRVLLLIILFLAILILAGTIFAVARGKDAGPLFGIGTQSAAAAGRAQNAAGAVGEVSVFTGIGRLRIPAQGNSTVILSIAFPYPLRDHAFIEELAGKITDFRRLAVEYFSSLSPAELLNFDEAAAKAEILKRYNALLRLGKITVLYFDDLMVIE